jgi:hypothetical protein
VIGFFQYISFIILSVLTFSRSYAVIISSVGFESYQFFQNPDQQSQINGGQYFFVFTSKARLKKIKGGILKTEFDVYETIDGASNDSFEINQFSWNYYGDEYSLLLGIDTVFWGVAESYNAVDIINQTDQSHSLDTDNKLGQSMIFFSPNLDNIDISFYYLPFFRTRRHTDASYRFRLNNTIDNIKPIFDNGSHNKYLDHAIRVSNTFGNIDFSLSYFNGYSRIPWFLSIQDREVEFYQNVTQLGLELQYTGDGLLLKLESALKDSKLENYYQGVIGAEFNLSHIQSTAYDINFFVEYIWNSRELQPIGILDNDVFIGVQLISNNTSAARIFMGLYLDAETREKIPNISFESRLLSDFSFAFDAIGYSDLNKSAKPITQDSYVSMKISYNF